MDTEAVILGQVMTIIAMVLLISTRVGNTYGDTFHLFGIDILLLVAVVVLLSNIAVIIYVLNIED